MLQSESGDNPDPPPGAANQDITNNTMSYQCKYCLQGFADPIALQFHMQGHSENFPYRCSFCPKKFTSSKNRDEHEELCKKKTICAFSGIQEGPHPSCGNTGINQDVMSVSYETSSIESIGSPAHNEGYDSNDICTQSVNAPQDILEKTVQQDNANINQSIQTDAGSYPVGIKVEPIEGEDESTGSPFDWGQCNDVLKNSPTTPSPVSMKYSGKNKSPLECSKHELTSWSDSGEESPRSLQTLSHLYSGIPKQGSETSNTCSETTTKSTQPFSPYASYECNTCHLYFTSAKLLSKHKVNHSEDRSYKCSLCPSAFKRNSHLKSHAMTGHSVEGCTCRLCKRFYMSEGELKIHEAEHECPKCGQISTTVYLGRKHMAKCHWKELNNTVLQQSNDNADLSGPNNTAQLSYHDAGPYDVEDIKPTPCSINQDVVISNHGDRASDGEETKPTMSSINQDDVSFSLNTPSEDVAAQDNDCDTKPNPLSVNQDALLNYQDDRAYDVEDTKPTLSFVNKDEISIPLNTPSEDDAAQDTVDELKSSPKQNNDCQTGPASVLIEMQRQLLLVCSNSQTADNSPSEIPIDTPSQEIPDADSLPEDSILRPNQCPICFQIFRSPQGLQRHADQHFGNRPFKCTICSYAFKRNVHLSDHMKRVHSHAGFKCTICKTFCPDEIELMKHEALHVCSICGITMKILSHLDAHKKTHNKSPKSAKRTKSYYLTGDTKEIELPSQEPGSSQNECPVCHKTFMTTRGLEKHSTQHTEVRPYICHICSFALKTNYNLSMHLKKVHSVEGFNCRHCRKFCATEAHLSEHEAGHTCSVCGSRYNNMKMMEKHMQIHLDQVSNANDNTKVSQDGMANKALHTEKHHKEPTGLEASGKGLITSIDELKALNANAKTASDQDIRPYKCKTCSWAFKRNSHLSAHMKRVHSSDGFSCKFCRHFFQEKGELRDHERSHTCDECGRSFPHVKQTVLHKAEHDNSVVQTLSDVRPFRCHLCGSSFKRNQHLKDHVRSLHPDYGFSCSSCKVFFLTDQACQQHMADHHAIEIELDVAKRCKSCLMLCQNDAELYRHSKRHNKSRSYKCKLCSRQFVATSQLQKHMQVHRKRKKYGCPQCPKMFNYQSKLEAHRAADHGEDCFECQTCGYVCQNKLEYDTHLLVHATFKCERCDMEFPSVELKAKHECKHVQEQAEATMGKELLPECPMGYDPKDLVASESSMHPLQSCAESMRERIDHVESCNADNLEEVGDGNGAKDEENEIKDEDAVSEHEVYMVAIKQQQLNTGKYQQDVQKADNQNKFSCRICEKVFRHKKSALTHERCHFQPRKFKCKTCYRKFPSEDKRACHENNCRPNFYRCQYEDCTESFTVRTKLESHKVKVHTGEYHTCDVCSKQYSTKASWSAHMRLHTMTKDIICGQCGKAFYHAAHLKEHMIHRHSEEKPFQCMYCGHGLKTLRHLKWHERQHRGENVYKCNHCDEQFPNRGRCKTHMQNVHFGRKHICAICGKGFTNSAFLRNHIMTHTGEKPHKCPHCDQRFRRLHHVKQHIPRHFKGTI